MPYIPPRRPLVHAHDSAALIPLDTGEQIAHASEEERERGAGNITFKVGDPCNHPRTTGHTAMDSHSYYSTGRCEDCGATWDTRKGEAPFWATPPKT